MRGGCVQEAQKKDVITMSNVTSSLLRKMKTEQHGLVVYKERKQSIIYKYGLLIRTYRSNWTADTMRLIIGLSKKIKSCQI